MSPLWILLHSWGGTFERRMLEDMIINVALYVPLGVAGYLAFRRYRWVGPVLLGLVLSASVEMAQLFTPTRDCSALDVVTNVAGSGAGVLLGWVFEQVASPARFRVPDQSAMALLFVWAGSLLFPLFPVLSTAMDRKKILMFANAPWLDWYAIVSAGASWVAVGCLMKAAGLRPTRLWLGLSLLLIPVQIFVITRQPVPGEVVGAIAGVAVFCVFGMRGAPWIFVSVLVFRGLAPFRFVMERQPFLWVPFQGFLETGWQAGIQLLLEKAFYYGTAVWLLRRVVKRWWVSALMVAVILAAIEVMQEWLPGRTAEITDPLLALLAGGALWVLRPAKRIMAGQPVTIEAKSLS